MSEHSGGYDPDAEDQPVHQAPQVEQLLRRVADVIASARPMPLSTSVMVNRDEVLELLNDALERLPEELRAARWLLKERAEFLAQTRRDGDEILDQARARAGAMVQRTEVVKAAEARARQIVEKAESDARSMQHQVEDFCDQRLASFEIVLERIARTVTDGRSRLQSLGINEEDGEPERRGERASGPVGGEGAGVFDQDVP